MALSQYAARMKKPEKPLPVSEADKFIVRFPEGMRSRIAEAAKVNNRSMNAEIVARLQSSFSQDPRQPLPSADMDQFVEELASRLAEKLKKR